MTKNDWHEAVQAVSDAELASLGEPPTDEEVLAFSRGELTGVAEARVREYLVHVPELLDALTAPFPPEDAPSVLTDAEVAGDWKRIRAPIKPARPWYIRKGWAIAASVTALALGGLLMESHQTNRRLEHELAEPRTNLDNRLLLPDGERGLGEDRAATLPGGNADFVFAAALINAPRYDAYAVALLDLATTPSRLLYSANGLRRHTDNTLTIFVPRAFLPAGRYRLVIYGLQESRRDVLATYTLRVPRN
ncbi:MAG: hypothetical protein JO197_02120 [Acidobacteria bacterium]|nr:hypothetical protein [Acidobacteriota bacterium]MBV9476824.1 hypothetical protein [Acidobacteriota bacterium]